MARTTDPKPARTRLRRPNRWRTVVKRVAIVSGVLVLAGGLGLAAAIPALHLPDVRGLQSSQTPQSTVLFDAKGRRITDIHGSERRSSVPLARIAPMLPRAVVAMEDSRFYQHVGIDPIGLMRAVVATIVYRHREGGSTLTQQLAKNLYLSPEQTPQRKLADMILAVQIERHYSKDQILELYLNQVYWGHGAFGCEAAAMTYFAKRASELNLAESALLAGILQGPEIFTPYRVPKVAKERQKLVLDRMLGLQFITRAQHEEAWRFPVRIHGLQSRSQAPYFTGYVQALLLESLGAGALRSGGLKVTTSLDLDWQRVAEQAIARQLTSLARYRVGQAALVCLDPYTGEIKAMVGGVDFGKSQFNRATQAHRQPGSSFKPFVYLTALSNGKTPDSEVVDEPVSFTLGDGRRWSPQNDDRRFRGKLTLRTALERSVNVVAVKLANEYGPDAVIQTARQCGISSPLQANLSLALGASEVTPLELASAYGVLATGGKYTSPQAILKIEDSAGKVLFLGAPELREVYHPEPIARLTEMMQGVLLRGTGKAAYFGRLAAGKTGTTSDSRDAWFAGFTPELVTVVWAGNDDYTPMRGLSGGAVCAPIWARFMRHATQGMPQAGFPTATATSDLAATPAPEASLEALGSPAATVTPAPEPTLESLPDPDQAVQDTAPNPEPSLAAPPI